MGEARENIYRSVRAEKDEIEKFLADLDERASKGSDVSGRGHERSVYRNHDCAIRLRQPGKIVAATAMTRAEDRERCLQAGFNHFLAKPYSRDDLSKVLGAARQEPLVSTLLHDHGMISLVAAIVEALPGTISTLEEAAQKELLKDLESAARKLKGEAGGCGFESISGAAEKLERGVQEGLEFAQIRPLVEEVVDLCLLARTPQDVQPPQN